LVLAFAGILPLYLFAAALGAFEALDPVGLGQLVARALL
jgi:hypothetical protein